ncbi:MAG: hypothetical protein M9952_10905 [Microthrixaceae bacterium]|nr:hypothetical protein [Microthrixaceae bacterium]MCO5313426.1 hypothetical protein [Microthrixaceae bacterium]HPB45478.1 hypothetical protein [Microthrixaceae bacterium]
MPKKVKALLYVLSACAIALGVWVYNNAVTGPDQTSLATKPYVDRLIPTSGSQAPPQATVGIDLEPGYDAFLVVNGEKIANTISEADQDPDGLRKAPTLGLIEYTPGLGKRVERLATPRTCVDAWVWKVVDGPDNPEQISWCFNVA